MVILRRVSFLGRQFPKFAFRTALRRSDVSVQDRSDNLPGQRAAVAWWSSSHIFSIQAEQVVDALRLELRTDTAYKAVAITNLATHR